MATKTQARGKKAPAAKKNQAKAQRKPVVRNVETPDKATFTTDDKRAQYARLVVFNFAVREKKVPKGKDVNTVANSVLDAAGKALAGGNMLKGKDGLELIATLSKAGATDEKVAKRGLTSAYAAEVRPFIKRLQFSPSFGRRAGEKKAKETKEAPAEQTEE